MNSDKTVVCGFLVLAVILQHTVAVLIPGYEVENECGRITIEEPDHLYVGRNVTLTFSPKKVNNEKPVLLKSNRDQFKYECLNACNNSPFSFVLIECPETLHNADFYVSYGCHSGYVRTRLKKLTDCGDSYIRTCTPKIGQVELVFIPNTAVVGFKDGYVLYWLETNPETGIEWRVNISEPNYEQRNDSKWAYVLLIHDVIRKNGYQYRVQCTDRPTQIGVVKYTDKITLGARVPEFPVLGPLVDIDDCRGCLLVGQQEFNSRAFFCTTNGGTNLKTSLKINGYTYSTTNEGNGTYRTMYNFNLDENDHLTSVVCSATNCATTDPLIASTTLYLAVWPDEPKLYVPVVYKGVIPNITCSSLGGRPKSILKFYLDGNILTSIQIDHFDNKTRTYSSIATVTEIPDRNWYGKTILCSRTQLHTQLEKVTKPNIVTYIYPPSDLKITVYNSSLTRPNGNVYPITVTCKSNETNARCGMSWTPASNSSIYLRPPLNTSRGPHISSDATINGFLGVRDVTVTCSVSCDHFEQVVASTIINLPYPPKIQINTTNTLIIEEGSFQTITCLADSYPLSNITWSYAQDGREQTSSCYGATLCSVFVSGLRDGEKREYMCSVEHMLLTSNKSFVAEGTAQWSEITKDDKNGSSLLVGALIGSCLLLAGVAVVTIVCFYHRRKFKRRTHRNDIMQRSHGSHASNANGDQLVEYAVVSKTSKSTASERVTTSVERSLITKTNPTIPSAHVNPAGPKTVVSTDTLIVSMADEYAVVSKTSPKPAIAHASSKATPKTNVSDGQLVYAELDRDVLETRPSATVPQQEEAVEYVDIDFSKKATIETDDNIYSNQ